MVLVSADLAVTEDFLQYASDLKERLLHLFFDEAHCAYTEPSFRKRLSLLWRLRYLDAPTTFLTATLPEALEGTLYNLMMLSRRHTVIYRQPTWRKAIQYSVVDSNGSNVVDMVADMLKELSVEFVRGQRGVVYVRSYDAGRDLQRKLGKVEVDIPFYKASADDKSAIFTAWTTGNGGWIIATGALGTGLDVAGVTHVIHAGRPYGMTNFVQQAARGGRNGLLSHSIVVVNLATVGFEESLRLLSANSVEAIEEEALTRYLKTTGCRQVAISSYMDGQEAAKSANCEEIDGVWCDCCKRLLQSELLQLPGLPVAEESQQEQDGSEMIAQRFRQIGDDMDTMMRVLNKLGRRCVYCEVVFRGTSEDDGHEFAKCMQAEQDQHGADFSSWKIWRSKLKLPEDEYSHCWRCGLPQSMCSAVTQDEAECLYPDIMLPVIFVLLRHGRLDSKIKNDFGFRGKGEADLMAWLGRTEICFNGKETPMYKIFRWFAREYEKQEITAVRRKYAPSNITLATRPSPTVNQINNRYATSKSAQASVFLTPPSSQSQQPTALDSLEANFGQDKVQRVLAWLSKYCIYCELKNAPSKSHLHWYQTCPRQPLYTDGCTYEDYVDWHDDVDQHRTGCCWSCKEDIDECDIRSSSEVTCHYAHVILPVLFILHQNGWLGHWMGKMGYASNLRAEKLQEWLNERSELAILSKSRAVEAFEAFAMEFNRLDQT
jgi:hypothetical protein